MRDANVSGSLTGVPVLVVGAGPQGLLAASELVDRGAQVTVVHGGPLTHPHAIGVAAAAVGLIEPVAMADEDAHLVAALCRTSLPYWMTADSALGVDRRSVRFHAAPGGVPAWVAEMPQARELANGDWAFMSAVVTPQLWLVAQVRRLRALGVQVIRRNVDNLRSVAREYPVIVNASGPGAWALGDEEMFGSRAVLVWSDAQVSEVRFDDERFLYGIPQRRYVGFGGTAVPVHGDPLSWDREPTSEEVKRIVDGAHDLYPELKRIRILAATCNYRPCRPRIRIETEFLKSSVVVHIVGFGGSGWTLAPGASRLAIGQLAAALDLADTDRQTA
jgi:glycine/D-amino acid oxidase-like deaminating enzyme